MTFFYVYIYVLYELFSSIMLCMHLLSCVNMCACHVYFTIKLLTYFGTFTVRNRLKNCNTHPHWAMYTGSITHGISLTNVIAPVMW